MRLAAFLGGKDNNLRAILRTLAHSFLKFTLHVVNEIESFMLLVTPLVIWKSIIVQGVSSRLGPGLG